jgi:hypothetical protein
MSKKEYQRMLDVEGWLQYLEASSKDSSRLYNSLQVEYKTLLTKYFSSKR